MSLAANFDALKALSLGAGLAFWFAYYAWDVEPANLPAIAFIALGVLILLFQRRNKNGEASNG